MIKNRFITKILMAYLCILVVGMMIASILLSNIMIDEIIQIQSKYEVEILEKIKKETDNRIKNIRKIYENLYLKNIEEDLSIMDLVMDNTDEDILDNNIRQFLDYSLSTNQYIADLLFVDYHRNNVYMTSEGLFKEFASKEVFFQSSLYDEVQKGKNEIKVSTKYKPDFFTNNKEIFTIYLNLIDSNNLNNEKKYGAILVNLYPEVFFNAYQNYVNQSIGRVVIRKGKEVYFDSQVEDGAGQIFREGIDTKSGRDNKKFIVNEMSSSVSDFTFYSIVDKGVLYKNIYDKLLGNIIAIVLVCILVGILVSILIAYIFGERINKISNHMKLIQSGNLDEYIEITHKDEMGELEDNLNKMSKKLKDYIETIYVNDLKMKKVELKSLQMQINPHFMFNTLEVIRSSALMNNDGKTARMISILGNMFRWNLRNRDLVILEDEIDYLESYIELQEMKNAGKLEIELRIPNQIRHFFIPKLTLQPIIENAINHGYDPDKNVLCIEISVVEQEETIEICIRDNGKGMEPQKLLNLNECLERDAGEDNLYHIGLRNIQQRIKIMLGEEYGLLIKGEVNVGTEVIVKLPKTIPKGVHVCIK